MSSLASSVLTSCSSSVRLSSPLALGSDFVGFGLKGSSYLRRFSSSLSSSSSASASASGSGSGRPINEARRLENAKQVHAIRKAEMEAQRLREIADSPWFFSGSLVDFNLNGRAWTILISGGLAIMAFRLYEQKGKYETQITELKEEIDLLRAEKETLLQHQDKLAESANNGVGGWFGFAGASSSSAKSKDADDGTNGKDLSMV
ncbi:hypothetical protein PPROV_000016200 [Pycnococcus provasolii]|uniref:Uncharacterized protein n=1 Tax=Pycnococcus provasolii TaxID=41880 RepID=A0A830H2Q1_9CHLO|nr:hypothetical protein PPROV_000016200 [Pycnococcus provasolii]